MKPIIQNALVLEVYLQIKMETVFVLAMIQMITTHVTQIRIIVLVTIVSPLFLTILKMVIIYGTMEVVIVSGMKDLLIVEQDLLD